MKTLLFLAAGPAPNESRSAMVLVDFFAAGWLESCEAEEEREREEMDDEDAFGAEAEAEVEEEEEEEEEGARSSKGEVDNEIEESIKSGEEEDEEEDAGIKLCAKNVLDALADFRVSLKAACRDSRISRS